MTFFRVLEPCIAEPPAIKGSRFIAILEPVASADEAMAVVERARKEHPKACHHTFAWRIGEGEVRFSDDGEPGGTAGRPLLDRLTGAGILGAVVVVVRYYGGTKLGCGGLVRAYGGAAGAATAAALLEERSDSATISVACPYELEGPLRGVISEHEAEVLSGEWGASVTLVVEVAKERLEELRGAVEERSAGRATITG